MMEGGLCYQLSKLEHRLAALREYGQSVETFCLFLFFSLLCAYNIVNLLTIKVEG